MPVTFSHAHLPANPFAPTRAAPAMKPRRRLLSNIIAHGVPLWLALVCASAQAAEDLTNLSIDQLLNMEITTASKKEQKLSETAAAVFVLTRDEILRSGATTLPELLLMAPGMEGGAINAHSTAVGIRGLGGQWSNKLVVLVDGRSVFTRTYSGVYWDAVNIPFEDIERIEIIRGANSAMWGANAVNGVINIITRNSGETQGTLLRGTAGTNRNGDLVARHGAQFGERGFARVYATGETHGESIDHYGGDADDAWNGGHLGFRADWASTAGTRLMAQADVHRLHTHNNPLDPDNLPADAVPVGAAAVPQSDVRGHSLQLNLTRAYSVSSEWSVQLAWSRSDREEFIELLEDSYDLDFQHHFQPLDGHDLVWGASVRYRRDESSPVTSIGFEPADADDTNSSVFFQDEMTLADDRLKLALGARFEHDEHNKWELQPSLRALWNLSEEQKLWAAVSRAARTPSRSDRDVTADFPVTLEVEPYGRVPITLQLRGDTRFKTEEMLSYEAGYRWRVTRDLSLDLALYRNEYKNVRAVEFDNFNLGPDGLTATLNIGNSMRGDVYGGELVASWTPASDVRIQAFWGEVRVDMRSKPFPIGSSFSDGANNTTPERQLGLRTDWDIASRWTTGLQLKYVSALNNPYNSGLLKDEEVPSYTDLDLTLSWQATPQWNFALLGKNLLDNSRLEFSSEAGAKPTEVRRAAYLRAVWSF